MLTKKRLLTVLGAYGAVAIAVLIVSPFFGGEVIAPADVIRPPGVDPADDIARDILVYHRVPRTILAFLVGSALALAGGVFQVILRNPLATPYTLGITGGGSLGALLAISAPGFYVTWGPISTLQFACLGGAAAVTIAVYAFATRHGSLDTHTLLLAGVSLTLFCSAMILFIRYLSGPYQLFSIERWLMGGLDITGYEDLAVLLPLWFPGVGTLFLQTRCLNQLAVGDDLASGYGVDVGRVRIMSFVGGSLATAGVVAVAGPIGFVGLIVPHAVRQLSGSDHRIVLPAAFLAGGSFLVICDTVARTLRYPSEIPVGIITSLIGVPFFIYLLTSRSTFGER